jgi:hypothetical protein
MNKSSITKKVAFHPKVQFSYVPHRESISKREMKSRWYCSSTLVDIEAKNKETLALMTAEVLPEEEDGYCARGLFTRKENRRRYEFVEAALLEVLRVQQRQFDEGYSDEQEIASKYSKVAYISRLEARNRGVRDEYESENKQWFSRPKSSETSRRRHSLLGDSTGTPTERFHPRRRISALGHL